MTFDKTRAMHSLGVAKFMKKYAGVLGLNPMEASLVGWMHDFGYMDDYGNNRNHAGIMASLLKTYDYPYTQAIGNHGNPLKSGPDDAMSKLLNIADMYVGHNGEDIGFDKRLDDVKDRYGEHSDVYEDCVKVIDTLRTSREWSLISKAIQDEGVDPLHPVSDQQDDRNDDTGTGNSRDDSADNHSMDWVQYYRAGYSVEDAVREFDATHGIDDDYQGDIDDDDDVISGITERLRRVSDYDKRNHYEWNHDYDYLLLSLFNSWNDKFKKGLIPPDTTITKIVDVDFTHGEPVGGFLKRPRIVCNGTNEDTGEHVDVSFIMPWGYDSMGDFVEDMKTVYYEW